MKPMDCFFVILDSSYFPFAEYLLWNISGFYSETASLKVIVQQDVLITIQTINAGYLDSGCAFIWYSDVKL